MRSTLSFRNGAAAGSRKCDGIRACIARMSVDDVGLDDLCNIYIQEKKNKLYIIISLCLKCKMYVPDV